MNEKYSKGYESFSEGVIACIPTIMGYMGIGLAAGVLGKSSGVSVLFVALMSIIIYGGSSQFIIIGMLVTHSPATAIIFTTFLVNARHFLMSLSVAEYFREFSLYNSIRIGSLLTDESYGVLMTPIMNGKKVSFKWVNGLNLTAYFVWMLATIIGALLGNLIPDPNQFGLDFALIAMFIGLVILQIESELKTNTKKILSIILSVTVSLYLLSHFIAMELCVLLSTLIGCAVGVGLDDRK